MPNARYDLVEPALSERPRPVERRHRFPSVSAMCWCVIGIGWRKIVPLDRNERLTAESYRKKCLAPCLSFLCSGKVFVRDRARCHWGATAKKTPSLKGGRPAKGERRKKPRKPMTNREYLARQGVEVKSDWAADMPNVNPIENVFSICNRRVELREQPGKRAGGPDACPSRGPKCWL